MKTPYHLIVAPDKAVIYYHTDRGNGSVTFNASDFPPQYAGAWRDVLAWFDSHKVVDATRNGPLSVDLGQADVITDNADGTRTRTTFPVFHVSAPICYPEGTAGEVQSTSHEMPFAERNALLLIWQLLEKGYAFDSLFASAILPPVDNDGNVITEETFDTEEERDANPSLWAKVANWWTANFGS